MKEIKSREDAWKACLALWKRLSKMPDCETPRGESWFKNIILHDLGYPKCENGCPFCEFFNDIGCVKCPLTLEFYGCLKPDCPYSAWSDAGGHDQKLAKRFYECLSSLHEKEAPKVK